MKNLKSIKNKSTATVARLKVTKQGERYGFSAKADGSTGYYKDSEKTFSNAWNAQSGAKRVLKKAGYAKALLVNESGRKVLKEISL